MDNANMHQPLTDAAIESEIKAKGLTAPRVTPAQIDALMVGVAVKICHFHGTALTLASVFLSNGFYVCTGESTCVSIENFDAEIGREVATDNALKKARDKLWELEGYALKKELVKPAYQD